MHRAGAEREKVTNYELTIRNPDRPDTVVSCNATPFYDRDRTLRGVIAAARDVTERKRLDLALLELINEILDLSLIETGKLSMSSEPMALAEVLADCQAMIEPQARKSGIRVDFLSPDRPLFVRADRIRVSFQDQGEGLSPDKLAQLFQPFNRPGQEGGVEEGTGIGLVVCKHLVELMGGAIGVESAAGLGSVFWVDLVAAVGGDMQIDALPTPASAMADVATGTPQRSVLCVEDNPANLMLVTRLLARRPDIQLLSAKDGRRGIELAQTAMPEVILMDINLPGISGLTALKILAGDPATTHIQVIALSANAMPCDIEKGLQAGFFRYLTKPIKIDEFMDTLDLALALAAARPAAPPHILEASSP